MQEAPISEPHSQFQDISMKELAFPLKQLNYSYNYEDKQFLSNNTKDEGSQSNRKEKRSLEVQLASLERL